MSQVLAIMLCTHDMGLSPVKLIASGGEKVVKRERVTQNEKQKKDWKRKCTLAQSAIHFNVRRVSCSFFCCCCCFSPPSSLPLPLPYFLLQPSFIISSSPLPNLHSHHHHHQQLVHCVVSLNVDVVVVFVVVGLVQFCKQHLKLHVSNCLFLFLVLPTPLCHPFTIARALSPPSSAPTTSLGLQ